jgi:RHS repeat-associated protein
MNASYSWMNNATLTDNAYQYNGKELNDDFGLNLNDYGARWYDGAVGRWWSVDPMGEKYLSWSGYNYALNRPSNLIDVDGNYVIVPYLSQTDLGSLNNIVQRYFGKSINLDVSNKAVGVDNSIMNGAILKLTGSGAGLNPEKRVVFDYLTRIFDDTNNTARIQLDNSEKFRGGFHNGEATISAFTALMDDSQTGVPNLDMGMFVHEISEQWYKQTILGLPQMTKEPPFDQVDVAYNESHYYAAIIESLVTGLLRGSHQDQKSGSQFYHFYTVDGSFKSGLRLDRDGNIKALYSKINQRVESEGRLQEQKDEMKKRRPNFSISGN